MVGDAGEAGNGWSTGQIHQFHDHLNSIESTIKFTIELEQEGSLPFLDTRVMRHSDGSLTTTVFKKTHLDRYLDCDTYHPLAHKVAVVQTLLTPVGRICSNIPGRDVEKKQVAGALSNNDYSTGLVKRNRQPSPMNQHLSLNWTRAELWWSCRTSDTPQNPSGASCFCWGSVPVLNHITP